MTVRHLPSRISPLTHAHVRAPEGVPPAPAGADRSLAGVMPSERTVWERQFQIQRRSQTMAVSRREKQGPRRTNVGQPTVRLTDRIDPVWEIGYEDQFSGTEWSRVSSAQHRLTTDARGNVTVKTVKAFSPISIPPAQAYSETSIRIMALLLQFGGLSTSQLCSFLDRSAAGIAIALNRLYAMGLTERMTPGWARGTQASPRLHHGSGDIWRPNLRSDVITEWTEGLPTFERALLTGGRDAADLLHNGTFMYDHTLRHNLAVAELCLRALETMPGIAGVWGEPSLSGDRFLSEKVRGSTDVRYVRGDAAVVTKDGGVIIIELTGIQDLRTPQGSGEGTLAERAAAWAAISFLSDIPMSLVVVPIGGYTASRRISKHLRDHTEKQLGRYFANVNEKAEALRTVHVASAHSWWPSASAISRKFLTMEAFSPFTSEYRELAPADAAWDTQQPVVMNTVAALHTPEWLLRPVAPIAEGDAA